MNIFDKIIYAIIAITFFAFSPGCAPEVGSQQWCADMENKSKEEWTASDASDFAKYCVFN